MPDNNCRLLTTPPVHMFKVKFTKNIFNAGTHADATHFAAFLRQSEVPFAPTVGQHFFWSCELPQKVITVTWDITDSSFTCKVEDNYLDGIAVDDEDFQDKIADTVSNGWTLISIFNK